MTAFNLTGPYGTILADPPWQFNNRASRAAAENHYGTMTRAELLALPIETIAADSAHLYLWTTDAHIDEALDLFIAWGFTYKQTLVWVKTKSIVSVIARGILQILYVISSPWPKLQIGLGNYYRHAHELCLFGTRGKAPARVHNLPSVFFAPRGKHSAKPEILQEWAEMLSPGPRVELFARRPRAGWHVWGNEIASEVGRQNYPSNGK